MTVRVIGSRSGPRPSSPAAASVVPKTNGTSAVCGVPSTPPRTGVRQSNRYAYVGADAESACSTASVRVLRV